MSSTRNAIQTKTPNNAFRQTQTAPAERKTATPLEESLGGFLKENRAKIMAAIPKHLTVELMLSIALGEARKNPKLLECDQASFLGAVISAAQLGLEPGSAKGHVYFIPFWNSKRGVSEVQFIPGYRGLIELTRKSGEVLRISSRVVREKDYFDFEYGDEERIVHKPSLDEDAGEITHVYAIAKLKNGEFQREVMGIAQVEAIRDRKKAANPVWDSDFAEMARKTVVRRIAKYLPLSREAAAVLEKDDENFTGISQENWRTIDADYQPVAKPHEPEKILEAQASAGTRLETEEVKQADKANAIALFETAVKRARALSINVEEVLKVSVTDLLVKYEANRIIAAADYLHSQAEKLEQINSLDAEADPTDA